VIRTESGGLDVDDNERGHESPRSAATGGQHAEESILDPNFAYVIEGTLSVTAGKDTSRTEADKAFALPLNTPFVIKNEGTARLRYIIADVHP